MMRRTTAPILLALFFCWTTVAVSGLRLPFQKKKYTPLIFFTLPKDANPECDAMESVVSQVEKDLGVKVERMDLLRDPSAQALLELVGTMPPLLYNRESCQVYHVPSPRGGGANSNNDQPRKPVRIDRDQVRAWAKGRQVKSPPRGSASSSNRPMMVSQEDTALDQDELLSNNNIDPNLSELQQRGKQAIQERTAAAAKE
ncbi:expressed unknown protein [Seminavis robusta]|uniref:Uncharacterized protein n=1 Tax=Seminavis robusta TaxID=568900 RepID=A0A9N8HF84_9STRA|nr:expressed unknown protein [Seminavis robusta]|eukprot:Sro337_g120590.1 n/a (200) ;mRNA; f:29874-30641